MVYDAVIRQIHDDDVTISFWIKDDEFLVEIPKSILEVGGVDIQEDEGFLLIDRKEGLSCVALQTKQLSKEEMQEIQDRVKELLGDEYES